MAGSVGGPPLKMRLKKSCRSAGLGGPGLCSGFVLKRKDDVFKKTFRGEILPLI